MTEREKELEAQEQDLEEVWEEARQQTHQIGSFDIDETIYRDIRKTGYKPSWSASQEKGIGKKWEFFNTNEINDLMESLKFTIVEGWGRNYDLDFEVESEKSIKTTDNHRYLDRGEYIPRVRLRSTSENEKGKPLIEATLRYVGPEANPEGITDWSRPDYLKIDIDFNTNDPKYREAYEALDLLIENEFEEYKDIIGTKWVKDKRRA